MNRAVAFWLVVASASLARADLTAGAPARVLDTHALAGPFAQAEDYCDRDHPHCVFGILWNFGTADGHDFIEAVELDLHGRHPLGLRTRRGWFFDEHALDELGRLDGTSTEEAPRRLMLYASRIDEIKKADRVSIVTQAETVLLCSCDARGFPRCAQPITARRRPADPDTVNPLGKVHLAPDGTLQLDRARLALKP